MWEETITNFLKFKPRVDNVITRSVIGENRSLPKFVSVTS